MKAKYLSRAQAHAMCHDYEQLRGEPLEGEKLIEFITVVPYSRILQWQYVLNVLDEDVREISSAEHPAGRYDVLLIARAPETDRGFVAQDLRSYLAARQVPFNSSRYACLRSNSMPIERLREIIG